MTERKSILLRLDPAVHDALARWASDELRSTNAQIEYLLRRALSEPGRLPDQVRAMRRPDDPPGRPQRGVAVQESPRKVPCGKANQGQLVDVTALMPIEFDDAGIRYAPLAQVRTHTEWHKERGPLRAGQRDDGIDVKMVVVVVADDHGVDGRQRQ